MAKTLKRVRWECPNAKHPAVLGSTRPLADATVRFCLPCSEEAGRLVQRVAPALEAKRAAKTVARETKAQDARRRAREERANALKVTVLDYEDGEVVLDAGELLKRAWASKALVDARRDIGFRTPGRVPVPRLTIRRGAPDKGRASRVAGRTDGRERDTLSGHAKRYRNEIVLTVAPGLGREWLEAIIVHEASHSATPDHTAHGRTWRSTYIRAMRELYGVHVLNTGQAAWRLDDDITLALRELGRGRNDG